MSFDIDSIKNRINEVIKELKKDKKLSVLLILFFVAISFLFFSGSDNEEEFSLNEDTAYESSFIDNSDLESFLENVYGAGKVKVMITYDSSKEYIYAKDADENIKDKNDNENEINYKAKHIIIKEDGNEKGLMIKEIYPEIRGIAVVCDGGNNPVIRERIVNILSALFGINTNRISVAAKSS